MVRHGNDTLRQENAKFDGKMAAIEDGRDTDKRRHIVWRLCAMCTPRDRRHIKLPATLHIPRTLKFLHPH